MIGAIVAWLTDPAHWQGAGGVPTRLAEHVAYALVAVLVAVLVGVPLGLLVGHTGRGTAFVSAVANGLRALPTLGLLVLLVILLLPHVTSDLVYLVPSEAVLVLLTLPPVLSGTYAGVQSTPPAVRDAAEGMGMDPLAVLLRVELPCALPLLLSGVRAATLQAVATATVAAYVSLGGLGRYIVDGLAQRDFPQMASGALLVAGLALLAEGLLAALTRIVVSPGVSGRFRASGGRRAPDGGDPARASDGRNRSARPLQEEKS